MQTSAKEKIMEIHQRMGHPSFHLLKKMYPHLFKDLEFEMRICNACQLGKFNVLPTLLIITEHRNFFNYLIVMYGVHLPIQTS